MLAVLRRELAGRKPAAKTLAVLADRVFSEDDERIRPGARRSAPQTAQSDPLNESVARILVQNAVAEPGALRIRRLPFTRQEAEHILPLAPAGAGMKALSFKANRATAMSDQLSQYRSRLLTKRHRIRQLRVAPILRQGAAYVSATA